MPNGTRAHKPRGVFFMNSIYNVRLLCKGLNEKGGEAYEVIMVHNSCLACSVYVLAVDEGAGLAAGACVCEVKLRCPRL
jgi:hypothetical protein